MPRLSNVVISLRWFKGPLREMAQDRASGLMGGPLALGQCGVGWFALDSCHRPRRRQLATMFLSMQHEDCVSGLGNLACQQRGPVSFLKTVEIGCFYLLNTVSKSHHRIAPIS